MIVNWLMMAVKEVCLLELMIVGRVYVCCLCLFSQERPYNHESTASRLLSEVKHDLARLVLRWGTTLESLVLFFFLHLFLSFYLIA